MVSTNSSTKKRVARTPHGVWVVPFLMFGVATLCQAQDTTEAGMQVLTRGPIHEAFAEASMTGAKAGIVIRKVAPDSILELPPDQRPEGVNVAWIPGYWSWDDDRSDFIWVSGVWRDIPPGRQWVPGYWVPAGNGTRWISGFWADVAQTEITYLPQPPRPLEAGPSSPSPGSDNIWTAGSWVWQQTRYDWQPGYWVPQQPDWVWSPAHYTWTPRGYVYVQGYWDRDMVHRGMMFAPVYYEQPVYRQPNYAYSPSTIIDLAVIVASLFVQPQSNHYYYGDYYGPRYEKRGIYPWHSRQVTRYGEDPMYMHYRSEQLRRDPNWDVHMEEQYKYRREHADARPPQTLALQVSRTGARKEGAPENVIVGKSLAEAAQSNALPVRLTPVNMDERTQSQARGREVHNLQSERAKLEMPPQAVGKSKAARVIAQPVRVQLPVSPVAARPIENVAGAKIPPPMPVAPKPHAVEGRERQAKTMKAEPKPAAQARPQKTTAQPVQTKEKPQRDVSNSKATEHSQEPAKKGDKSKTSGKR